jgi:hypothetical protein
MTLKTKKIVAREVIVLFSCMALYGLSFLVIGLINWSIQRKIDKTNEDIQAVRLALNKLEREHDTNATGVGYYYYDSSTIAALLSGIRALEAVDSPYFEIREYVKFYANQHSRKCEIPPFVMQQAKSDTDNIQYQGKTFHPFKKNKDSAIENKFEAQSIYYQQEIYADKIKSAQYEGSFLDVPELALGILFGLSVLLFPFRYIVYLLIWCIKTLRAKD